jgi:chromate transporter
MSEPSPASPAPPGLPELFIAFALISLYGFGGVLFWSRRMMVDERKWMSPEAFNEAYALCNFLPGPNIVNFSVVFGRQMAGTAGALVALVGLVGPPFLLVTILGVLYSVYGDIAALRRVLAGVAAAAAGLTISTGAKMAEPLLRQQPGLAHGVAIAAFVAVGVLQWPIYWVLGVLVPASAALIWWMRR